MKEHFFALIFTAVLSTYASFAVANGPSNVSDNVNILDGHVSGQLGQDQGQGQQQGQGQHQVNDSHNTAISAPTQGQQQDNVAVGGTGGNLNMSSNDKVSNRSYTMFGPQANAFRSGDCAGDADGISLYSIFGGIGYSHADESETCRIMGTIQMTCSTANGLVQTGAILAQNNQLNATGQRILAQAVDMVAQCVQQMQANPIALQLRAAYGKHIVGNEPVEIDD